MIPVVDPSVGLAEVRSAERKWSYIANAMIEKADQACAASLSNTEAFIMTFPPHEHRYEWRAVLEDPADQQLEPASTTSGHPECALFLRTICEVWFLRINIT